MGGYLVNLILYENLQKWEMDVFAKHPTSTRRIDFFQICQRPPLVPKNESNFMKIILVCIGQQLVLPRPEMLKVIKPKCKFVADEQACNHKWRLLLEISTEETTWNKKKKNIHKHLECQRKMIFFFVQFVVGARSLSFRCVNKTKQM